MVYDILIIGGGAAGLMAAYGAASQAGPDGSLPDVAVLEKMPRPGRKIMITGKGRCNFTNAKPWEEFSSHIRSKANFLRPAFYRFSPEDCLRHISEHGVETVVERGDRAFPASHRSSDIVDALAEAATKAGAVIRTGLEAENIVRNESAAGSIFLVSCKGSRTISARRLIIATGGLSYPGTGSTGDGYGWAQSFGHSIKECFPSLTAIVPKGYKTSSARGHIERGTPLSEIGKALCGNQLKNIRFTLFSGQDELQSEFGDLDFTDGGIEGPVGFKVSRNAVKAILNGARLSAVLDMKPEVGPEELTARISGLWNDIVRDPRSRSLNVRARLKVLLGKLMPQSLIAGFTACHREIICGAKGHERIDFKAVTSGIKEWRFDLDGYVGYERAVVTAGGVSTNEVVSKTMESKKCGGLYFCGEVLDIDADTGGYNLQLAFSTGYLAGVSAAKSLAEDF